MVEKGNLLVSAINSFREQEGHLPDVLDDLLPNYLNELPSYKFGGRGFYYRAYTLDGESAEFSLSCIVRPGGFMLLSAHAVERLKYDPKREIYDSPTTEVLGRRGDWVFILSKRVLGGNRSVKDKADD